MKDYSQNNAALNTYPEKFARVFAEDEDLADILDNAGEALTDIKNVLESINQQHPQSPAASLSRRLDAVAEMTNSLKILVNPNTNEAAKKNAFGDFAEAINTAMGKPYNSFDGSTFGEDIAELLKTVGHDAQNDSVIEFFKKIDKGLSDIQDISEDLEKKDIITEVNNRYAANENKYTAFNNDRDEAIRTMYQINPTLTAYELTGIAKHTAKSAEQANDEYEFFISEVATNGRRVIREEAEKKYREKAEEIKNEQNQINELNEKAQQIKSEGKYCIDTLKETDDEWTQLDNANKLENEAITRMEQELNEAENSKKLIKEAEQKLANAKANQSSVLEKIDEDGDFKAWSDIQRYAGAAFTATELIPELLQVQKDGKLFPALLDMGIINGIPGSKMKRPPINIEDKGYIPRKFLEKKQIAEKYVKLRNAIIEATRPVGDNSGKETEAEKFFKELETGRDQYAPMEIIQEKFLENCSVIRDDAISSQMMIVARNPDLFTDPTVNAEKEKVNAAQDELDELKNRIGATRKSDIIKDDIKRAKERIQERNDRKLEMSNDFLEHFGEEARNEPLSIADLGVIGEKKYAELKTEALMLGTKEHISENQRELNTLILKVNETSVEAENSDKESLLSKKEKTAKQKEVSAKLKKTVDGLHGRYSDISTKQAALKETTAKACHHMDVRTASNALSTVARHIEDATRFISHTNSREFGNMADALGDAITSLNDRAVSDEIRISKLNTLKDETERYLAAKAAQSRGVFASTMRKSRIDYANQILNTTNKVLNRYAALTNSAEWKTAQHNIGSQPLVRMSEAQFNADFKTKQEDFRLQQQQNQLQHNNAEPIQFAK